MSTANYTPAPWQWDCPPWDFDPKEQAPWLVNPEGDRVIHGELGKMTEADARLIAAAPELLEACRTFEEWLRREEAGLTEEQRKIRGTPEGEAEWRSWFYENMRLCDLAQKQARAAIAKATGGEQ